MLLRQTFKRQARKRLSAGFKMPHEGIGVINENEVPFLDRQPGSCWEPIRFAPSENGTFLSTQMDMKGQVMSRHEAPTCEQMVSFKLGPVEVKALQKFAAIHQTESIPRPQSPAELSHTAWNVFCLALTNPEALAGSISQLMQYIRAEGLEADPLAQSRILHDRIAATCRTSKRKGAKA